QRAEMAGVKSTAVEEPVVPCGGIGNNTRFVHVAGLHLVVRRRPKRNSHSDRDNDEGQTENAPWIHAKPPFERAAKNPPRRCETGCPNLFGVEYPFAMLEARQKESQRRRRPGNESIHAWRDHQGL